MFTTPCLIKNCFVKTLVLTILVAVASSTAFAAPTDSLNLPQQWQYTEFSTQPAPQLDHWWSRFDDDVLTRLIALAVDNNYDAKAALRRIAASRAALRQTYSDYYPQISANAGYTYGGTSGRQGNPATATQHYSYATAGLSASWEIDIFGRIAANAKEAKASLNLSRIEYDALMVTLASNVASEYFSLRMYESQLATTKSQIDSQEGVLRLVDARFEAGLVSKLDVAQQRTVVLQSKTSLPSLEANIAVARNNIATLCGVSEEDIATMIGEGAMPIAPHIGNVGAPADLLRRRPDIVEAEQQMALMSARCGIAKKDFLPTLSLEASASTVSHRIDGLFHKSGYSYMIAPTLSWTIFDGLARNYAVVEAKENLKASVEDYNMTVAQAVADVNNAMAQYIAASERFELYAEVVKQSRETLHLSMERYKLGLTDFSDVASAQQSVMTALVSLDSARGDVLLSIVQIYEALGGGSGN